MSLYWSSLTASQKRGAHSSSLPLLRGVNIAPLWLTEVVKSLRLAFVAAVIIALVPVAVLSKGVALESVSPIPCTPSALIAGFNAASPPSPTNTGLFGIEKYDCVGPWAFIWANAGENKTNYFGITVLSHFDTARSLWLPANRATYCKPNLLPRAIYLGACFSN